MSIAEPRIVVVDYKLPKPLNTITFLQYDTNIIKFIVEDNGEIADLSNITNIVVNFRRADKKVISQVLTADGNEITYRLTDSEMLKVGECEVALQLYDDEERLTVAKFKIIISDNIESGEAPTVGEVRLVQQLIDRVNERMEELSEIERGIQGPPGPPGEKGDPGLGDERLDGFMLNTTPITSSENRLVNGLVTSTVIDDNTIEFTTGTSSGYAGFTVANDINKKYLAVTKMTNIGTTNINSIRLLLGYRTSSQSGALNLIGSYIGGILNLEVGETRSTVTTFSTNDDPTAGKLNHPYAALGYQVNSNGANLRFEQRVYDVTNLTAKEIDEIDWLNIVNNAVLKATYALKADVANAIQYKGSKWKGKTWLTPGDSISSPGIYQSLVQNELGFGTVINRAVAGKTILGMLESVTDTDIQNADLITIYGALNNMAEGAPRLGDITDEPKDVMSGNSFISNLKYVIEYILTRKPTVRLVIIGTHNASDYNGVLPEMYQPINGTNNIGSYVAAMGEIARYYGLPFIDMYANSGINALTLSTYTTDGIHFNTAGYERIASVISGELQRIEPIQ